MRFAAALTVIALTGCVTVAPPPQWNPRSDAAEAEYEPFLRMGGGMLAGQAFLTQRGGGVVKAAGRAVTLDPATSIGNEWWGKAGRLWVYRMETPPSPGFVKSRRTTVADAEGRFRFVNLPAGTYYVRTEVTWDVPNLGVQGGLVGQPIEIRDGQVSEVILSTYPQ